MRDGDLPVIKYAITALFIGTIATATAFAQQRPDADAGFRMHGMPVMDEVQQFGAGQVDPAAKPEVIPTPKGHPVVEAPAPVIRSLDQPPARR